MRPMDDESWGRTLNSSGSRWPGWELPPAVVTLVVPVIGAYVGVVLWGSLTTPLDSQSFVAAAAFGAAAVLSVELSMRFAWPRTRKDRISRDFLGVWRLPIALLLPPFYVAVVVLMLMLYMQFRLWRRGTVKFAYTAATIGLAYIGASAVMRVLSAHHSHWNTGADWSLRNALAVTAAIATWWAINAALIAAVVGLTSGRAAVSEFFGNREGYLLDLADVCAGVAATVLWLVSPFAVLLLVPPVLLMQHQLFSGLRHAVRTDLLTEVANPQYWRETASREIDRAWASGGNLSLLMIDIDYFKQVNDRYGHLAGDEVLAAVARTISKALRPGDLVGRLGGEEFGAVLTGLNLLDAEGAAERLRVQVAELLVRSERGDWIAVTVSVGVAELSVTGGDLRHLLDAADTALYAAKRAGRNCVRVAGPQRRVIDLTQAGPVTPDDAPAVGLDPTLAPATPPTETTNL
jgi:diguanylate cyclase (GGDEF)-like protein